MTVVLVVLAVAGFVLVVIGAVLAFRGTPWMEEGPPGLRKAHNLDRPSRVPMVLTIAGGVISLVAGLWGVLPWP